MKKKLYLIIALVAALILCGGTYAYTYNTAGVTTSATDMEADIATCNTTATQPDWESVMPGVGGTEILRPNAAGDESNITNETGAASPDHYQNVDDVTPDEGTTTVYAKSPTWERDLYNIADHIEGSGVVNSVTVYARAMVVEPPVQTALKIVLKSGVTVSESVERTVSTGWVDYSNNWATNPATGDPFIWSEIDSLQVGISIREASYGKETYVTQVYVAVDYGAVTRGEVPTGDLFVVYPNADYTGDLAVKVYLANAANLTKAYQYLNMKLYLEGSVEAGEIVDHQFLTLDNGVAIFNLEAPHNLTHTLSVIGGSYGLNSRDPLEWPEGYTVTPELYCEVQQR